MVVCLKNKPGRNAAGPMEKLNYLEINWAK
jgi:hypothetical protein